MDIFIEAAGLTKAYDGRPVVDGLDLQVRRGEIFALLGPNGAGKTTTVEMLEGYCPADAGRTRVLGVDPARPTRAWRDRIGIVGQSSTGLGLLTGREIVRSTAHAYRHPREVRETLAAVGLLEHPDTRIGELSGGLRRRVDVALGIVGSPDLLFLDEPTTGFDPQARRDFWGLISGLARGGTTIVLTTHYLDEAEHLADRVGVMVGGRLAALGAPSELAAGAGAQATVSWSEAGGIREEHTSTPTATVHRLCARFGPEIPGLRIRRPCLEDTYLDLMATTTTEVH